MVDDNKYAHRRFSPGDQALLIKRCKFKDTCCVANHIGKVVDIVGYGEDIIPPVDLIQIIQMVNDIFGFDLPTFDEVVHDYIIVVDQTPALVFDFQLMPLGGSFQKDEVPEKPEVVH